MTQGAAAAIRRSVEWMKQPVGRVLTLCGLLVLGAGAAPGSLWAGEPPEEKMDCKVYETKKRSVTVGLKAGNFLFNVGPEVTWTLERGVAWDQAVHGLIARYVELCGRYNAGEVTKEEYQQRLREIDNLYKEAIELQNQLIEQTHKRAKDAHAELEEATGGKKPGAGPAAVALQQSVERLASQVEQLEPVGRRLCRPSDPTQPGATTGTVGAAPDCGPKGP